MGKKAQRLSQSWTWTAMGQTVSNTERADAMDRVLDVLFGSGSGTGMVRSVMGTVRPPANWTEREERREGGHRKI
jgi:hypothetical protein